MLYVVLLGAAKLQRLFRYALFKSLLEIVNKQYIYIYKSYKVERIWELQRNSYNEEYQSYRGKYFRQVNGQKL